MYKIISFFLLIVSLSFAQPINKSFHKPWNQLLKKYVTNGFVNYTSWSKSEDRQKLNNYLNNLKNLEGLDTNNPKQQLALYINAYNAYTVKVILDNLGITSIRKISPNAWDQKIVNITGKIYSLNHLEHKIIRPQFNEPLIHFALVCASISCPALQSIAYTAKNLNTLLKKGVVDYLANPKENIFTAKTTKVSKLFKWYSSDFGDVKTFLKKYAPKSFNSKNKIRFKSYDWGLNGK